MLGKFLRGEDQSFGGQIADGPIEDLQSEQLLYKRVVLQE
jgi:hypothetical protein